MRKKIHELMEDFFFESSGFDNPSSLFVEAFEKKFLSKKFDNELSDSIQMSQLCASSYLDSYAYFLYRMHKDDGKIYLLENNLAEALYHTDSTFLPDEIKFPFNTFIIYIENSTLKSLGEVINNEWKPIEHEIQYIMVNFVEYPEYKYMTFMIGFLDKGASPDNIKAWNNTTLFNLNIPRDQKLSLKKGDLEHLFPIGKIEEKYKKPLADSTEGIINFLFNFALYITEIPDDEIYKPQLIDVSKRSSKSKIDQAIKQNQRESKYIVHYIGKKYHGLYQKSNESTKNILKLRILVRGHWRMQWYGPRTAVSPGTRQKRIWIEPFWKGPENSEDKKEIFIIQ